MAHRRQIEPSRDPNIEDVLLYASREAMDRQDLRVFGLLVQWLQEHLARVHADRLTRIVARLGSERVRVFWSAVATAHASDRRLRRLAGLYRGVRVDLVEVGTDFQISRHGEDELFEGTRLRVAGNLVRRRGADVLSPAVLAAQHRAYYYRVKIGPSYRADMWAALEREPALTPSELARRAYGSFATAWAVHRDFAILEEAEPGEGGRKHVA